MKHNTPSPSNSAAIHTDDSDLITASITIHSSDAELPCYYAKPIQYTEPLATILVIQEIFGVNHHIQDICRRLAKQGYLAIAPELYFRQGSPSESEDINLLIQQIVNKVPDHQVMADLDQVVRWASELGGSQDKLGITGFCWGGRIAWLYTAHNPHIKAAVAWYGKFTAIKNTITPYHPIDIADRLHAPVLGLYGALDELIPLENLESMRQALRAANDPAEIIIYPEAGHAFFADYRSHYHASSAQDAWQRMLNWFKKHQL